MKVFQFNSFAIATLILTIGCAEDGHSGDCNEAGDGGAGGEAARQRAAQVDGTCFTPVGGSCLTEEEFKADRPAERTDDETTITINDDWAEYQRIRVECDFPCQTRTEFAEGRSDERVDDGGETISLEDEFETYKDDHPECFTSDQ